MALSAYVTSSSIVTSHERVTAVEIYRREWAARVPTQWLSHSSMNGTPQLHPTLHPFYLGGNSSSTFLSTRNHFHLSCPNAVPTADISMAVAP